MDTDIYVLENIRIKYWLKFLNKMSTDMVNLLSMFNVKKYKLEQKIIHFNTYLLGICNDIIQGILPPPECIENYKVVLLEDLKHNWDIPQNLFEDIIRAYIGNTILFENKLLKNIKKHSKDKTEIIIKQLDGQFNFHVRVGEQKKIYTLSKQSCSRLNMLSKPHNEKLDMHIVSLLKRYEYFSTERFGITLSANEIYDFIKMSGYEDNTLEAFAGSLNSNLKNYCSLFPDIETYFCSKGSFFKYPLDKCKYNIIVSNPPYITSIMHLYARKILQYMDTCKNAISIIIIPDWRSVKEYESDKNIQLSHHENKQTRQNIPYDGYYQLRESKYFSDVYCIGSYEYDDYFRGIKRVIDFNTLIVVISNGSHVTDEFKNFMYKKYSFEQHGGYSNYDGVYYGKYMKYKCKYFGLRENMCQK
jgi:hypothetical protein